MSTSIRQAGLYALAAAASFSLMGAAIKQAALDLNTPMVVFLRNVFGLLALLPWLARQGAVSLRTQRPGMHLTRCLIGLSAMYCFFYAIAHMPLAEAMLLNYSTPLYVPLIAWMWLRERPGAGLLPIIVVGFIGVSLLLQPGQSGSVGAAGWIGLAAGVLAAGAFVAIRRLSRSEPPVRIVFYFTVLGLLFSLLPLPLFWHPPQPHSLLLMAVAGAFATGGQMALTRAYSLAPAAQVAPFNYLVVVFAAFLGWLLWQEHPNALSLFGAALVIGSSLMALRQR